MRTYNRHTHTQRTRPLTLAHTHTHTHTYAHTHTHAHAHTHNEQRFADLLEYVADVEGIERIRYVTSHQKPNN